MEVIGQSIEIVPAGLVTVAPDMTTSAPIDIDPPVLFSMHLARDRPRRHEKYGQRQRDCDSTRH